MHRRTIEFRYLGTRRSRLTWTTEALVSRRSKPDTIIYVEVQAQIGYIQGLVSSISMGAQRVIIEEDGAPLVLYILCDFRHT